MLYPYKCFYWNFAIKSLVYFLTKFIYTNFFYKNTPKAISPLELFIKLSRVPFKQ